MPSNTTASAAVPATESYAAAYAKLSAIAAKLKTPASAASINELARDVWEAKQVFSVCSARLAAIRAESKQKVWRTEAES